MPVMGTVITGKYLDSVKLMLISKQMRLREGVQDAVAIMATPENKAILEATGMLLPEFSSAADNSICIGVKADSSPLITSLMEEVKVWLDKGIPGMELQAGDDFKPRSIKSAMQQMPAANLVLISLAGRYAGRQARIALEAGLNVMLFSDNVSLETERSLKEYAISRGLLLMGPDCGTAIINGVPLAFANAVRRGKIGIVSASGTGLQEVSSIIHNSGEGISQAFGTGGRDGKKEIGGLMLLQCLQYLIADPSTEMIALISKVPDAEVINKLWKLSSATVKPIVFNFLQTIDQPDLKNVYPTATLAETAYKACRLLRDIDMEPASGLEIKVESLFSNRSLVTLPSKSGRRHLRGLFSGGTLCYEAQNIYYQYTKTHAWSNAPLDKEFYLKDVWHSTGDTIIDLGADEFTVGRPHPMIDYSLRLMKLEEESRDDSVAVILLDVVLGYGSHPAPQLELAPALQAIKQNTDIITICCVVGTDEDPQDRQEVIRALQKAGAIVTTTNAEACSLAARIIQHLGSL